MPRIDWNQEGHLKLAKRLAISWLKQHCKYRPLLTRAFNTSFAVFIKCNFMVYGHAQNIYPCNQLSRICAVEFCPLGKNGSLAQSKHCWTFSEDNYCFYFWHVPLMRTGVCKVFICFLGRYSYSYDPRKPIGKKLISIVNLISRVQGQIWNVNPWNVHLLW